MVTLEQHCPIPDLTDIHHFQHSMSKDKNDSDQPAPFRGEFSFVNKDAGNIDSKEHNAAVSWHVMNRYERWKKQELAKKLRASANVPIGPLSEPSIIPQQQVQSKPGSSQPPPTSRPQHSSVRRFPYSNPRQAGLTDYSQTRTIPTTPSFGFDPWTAEPVQLGYAGLSSGQGSSSGIQTSAASTPSTHSSLLNDEPSAVMVPMPGSLTLTDPSFDEAIGSIGTLVSNLISFAYEVFIPQLWPKESERSNHTYELARSWDDASFVNQDTCYFNAYLSLLAASMATASDDESLLYQTRSFQGPAMTELRARVARQGSQDLITLKAILKLFSSETIVDNTSTARMHLKMLRNLVNGAGGIILLDSWFREDLLSCDAYFALKYETRPLFPAQEWTPGPLSQPWKARLMSAGIFGDHAAGIDPLIDHPVLKAVMTDLRELFKTNEYTQSHDVPADDQLLRWQRIRTFDCISRLADHYVNLAIYPHLFSRPLCQAYACIATALVANMVLGSPEPVRFGLKLLNDLRNKLVQSESEEEQGQFRRLRLWAFYVGFMAEKVHPVDKSQAGWFERNYQSHAAALGASAWEDTKRVVRQFLYSDNLHQEIMGGRSYRLVDARQGYYAASGCSWREPMLDTGLVGKDESELGGNVGSGKQPAAGI
ncbi:hypothetical protein B0A52_05583 [Exophiala mesophila]|uniref:Transcription factor domain-containing protein n=1 Tax=Exophiala mesophila TaxID=212818 RepID=A0A438N3C9_EXOME|nr:hypothetical protein B0A52_05583 [Exophiala mesophila]